ncbi:MAG: ATPase [Candidatus Thermoplasmatota archaeon]|nr:ATPase [Euryarchaeota archaeon]MBU4031713.1 ATPase [Candidatus Thermoplasmatota archaeon]MBU4071287.1 ATPase [Candidatus Thermoplasmatota archaeon]MBU4145204.1 ATPase [Candidatus Thermoplasmatota archaeon]MBU4592197.1 ATPase [Candidatus Thermoplasmatota archaeon]
MAQKAIREADGKRMMARLLKEYSGGKFSVEDKYITVGPDTDMAKLPNQYKWLTKEKLVVKPDQLIKRRGKNNLILVGANFEQAKKWIKEKSKGPITIYGKFDAKGKPTDKGTFGQLTHFIIEPMVPHKDSDECYVAIMSTISGDTILFYHQGGVNVGDIDAKASRLEIPVGTFPSVAEIEKKLMGKVPADRKKRVAGFVEALFKFYADLNFAYLEINPIVVTKDSVMPLDLAAKLDSTADFESGRKWGPIEFPSPFGRNPSKEEAYIEDLDSKTGSSLKLTVLNPEGRVWTMVAGGGASVIFADTITDLGFMSEMANYGEYSGDPNEEFTYKYAKTILDLMTRKKNPKGKFLLIGGGIANFTDVAKTFKGIIRALEEYQKKLVENKIKIYVRRGGPNFQEGLKNMRKVGESLGVPIEVYGPETHMTKIVSMALKGGK